MTQVLPDDNAYLRRLWEAIDSPYAHTLLNILGDLQKTRLLAMTGRTSLSMSWRAWRCSTPASFQTPGSRRTINESGFLRRRA